jgi:hypothetical protein
MWIWNNTFQKLKENYDELRLMHVAKLHFLSEEEINNFHNEQTLKEFIMTKLSLQRHLKEFIHRRRR